jgi:hypothetical protein
MLREPYGRHSGSASNNKADRFRKLNISILYITEGVSSSRACRLKFLFADLTRLQVSI